MNEWTPWTCALAWGDLLVEMHRDRWPGKWEGLHRGREKHAAVLIGRAVQAAAWQRDLAIAEPSDAASLTLVDITGLVQSRREVTAVLVGPELGPTSSQELGYREQGELRDETPERLDQIHQLCLQVCRTHCADENFRDDATLGNRCRAHDRDQLLVAARTIWGDEQY